MGTIAGGVAHNFNNLLAIVLGNLDLASRPRSDVETDPSVSSRSYGSRGAGRQIDVAAPLLRPPTAPPLRADQHSQSNFATFRC